MLSEWISTAEEKQVEDMTLDDLKTLIEDYLKSLTRE